MTNEPKATHTPGPWKWYWREEDGKANCGVFWEKLPGHAYAVARAPQYEKWAQWEANARLIAAAPDLLALAKQYASECSWCSGTGTIEHVPFDNGVSSTSKCIQCADIRAVIAKAEGSE